MQPRPSVIVFDVNETLSDMAPLAARFADVGAPDLLAKVWFASVLRDGFALAAADRCLTHPGGQPVPGRPAGASGRKLCLRHVAGEEQPGQRAVGAVTTTRLTPAWPIRCTTSAACSPGRTVVTPNRISVPALVPAVADANWSRTARWPAGSSWTPPPLLKAVSVRTVRATPDPGGTSHERSR